MPNDFIQYRSTPLSPSEPPPFDSATWGAEPDCVYWVGSFPAWADQEPLTDADEEAINVR